MARSAINSRWWTPFRGLTLYEFLSMLRRTPLDSNEVHTKLVHPTSKMRIIHRFVCDVIDLPDNCHGRTLRHEKGIPRDRFRQARLVRSCEPRE